MSKKHKESKTHTVSESFGGKVSCWASHPALKLPNSDLVIHGGSASNPVKGTQVALALDGYTHGYTPQPWDTDPATMCRVSYYIQDRTAPADHERFIKMIDWLCNQLHEGKVVHVGCMGGHGRTGTVLAAVVAKFGGEDAIAYVRENYCKKAVESTEQVKFLMKHFGVKEAKPSDHGKVSSVSEWGKTSGGATYYGGGSSYYGKGTYERDKYPTGSMASAYDRAKGGYEVITPGPSAKNFWKIDDKKAAEIA